MKYTKSQTDNDILHELKKRLDSEKSYEHVFSSMCTPPEEISRKIAAEFAEINLGDPGLFPKAVLLEKEVLDFFANLLHAPNSWTGTITSGGSESNLLGCWAARNWSRKIKGIKNGQILFPQSAHVSFEKAADLLDIEAKWLSLNEKNQVDIEQVKTSINKKTIGIVGIAGTTGTGACDDIKALSDIAIDQNLYLHVDAAFGGMIFPFLEEIGYTAPKFDFKLEGVNSITIDTHKIVGGLIPGGNIIFRSSEFSNTIAKTISYLSDSTTQQITVTGTRPGNVVISAWVLLKIYGRQFIVDRVKRSFEVTEYLISKLRENSNLQLAFQPTINIIGFKNNKISTKELVTKLKIKGWDLSIYSDWARIVVMPHVTKEMVDKISIDLEEILKE
ncbi:MAG TPA: tyrosine decarboxylase MfnA [candidate division Zixibacteria bacterium]|nr:tyrosine decarboxylase MfnA [candidate division Zixibacteria bacterium]